jgi:7-cyano-7-deazaguanine synthase in queuosine biosynthesis
MIDYERHLDDELNILPRMLKSMNELTDAISLLKGMSGRFVLIVVLQTDIYVFNDAIGLRPLTYYKDDQGKIWCASQAETIAERFGLPVDSEVLEFQSSRLFQQGLVEFWLMNDRTPFKQIRQLLPNHYLDVRHGIAIRFWPVKCSVAPKSVRTGLGSTTPILQNSITSASRKFKLAMGISAGIDSRRTLAATRAVTDQIRYFTIQENPRGTPSLDALVAGRLLKKLNIPHQIIGLECMDEEFMTYYNASSTLSRYSKGNNAYSIFRNFPDNVTILNSNTSEITQQCYWLPKSKINGEGLAVITGLYHPLAIKEFNKWLETAKGVCDETGFDLLTLFHWEQKGGRWAMAAFAEYDIVHETFTPYNNRLFICHFAGINIRYRQDRRRDIILDQIMRIWPEVLIEPINPPATRIRSIEEFIRNQLLHKGLRGLLPTYQYIKYLSKQQTLLSRLKLTKPTQ